jgi:hypothetical protein
MRNRESGGSVSRCWHERVQCLSGFAVRPLSRPSNPGHGADLPAGKLRSNRSEFVQREMEFGVLRVSESEVEVGDHDLSFSYHSRGMRRAALCHRFRPWPLGRRLGRTAVWRYPRPRPSLILASWRTGRKVSALDCHRCVNRPRCRDRRFQRYTLRVSLSPPDLDGSESSLRLVEPRNGRGQDARLLSVVGLGGVRSPDND